MIIDFKNIEVSVMPHFKGGEGETRTRSFFDGLNKIMQGHLDVGCSIGYHKHETNSEIILITSGIARCLYDGGERDQSGANAIIEEHLTKGDCHYCPRGHSHSLINASDSEPLEYFAIVPEHENTAN